jgi:hypothetical protein
MPPWPAHGSDDEQLDAEVLLQQIVEHLPAHQWRDA